MGKDKLRTLTASDLPGDVVRQHRVMFLSGTAKSMRVVTDQVRVDLAMQLSEQLGFAITVVHVDECGDAGAQQAYPMIMAQCATTKNKVKDITATQSADSGLSGRRKLRRAPKPE